MEELGLEVLFALVALILYILSAQLLDVKQWTFLHESAAAILFGAGAALLLGVVVPDSGIEFSTELFFYFVLPPIIFAAGYTLKSERFFVNIGFITLYGFVGTFISFVSLAALAVFFNENGALEMKITTKECLLIACVLSATDTVAAHSVVKESKYPKLNSILFGEGVINDAVSIVLFRTVETLSDEFRAGDFAKLLLNFVWTTVASVVIGVAMGLLASWILKHLKSINKHPDRETTLIILVGYASYMIAEILDLSGIMTIFCCGVTMAHYAWFNLSKKSQQGTDLVFVVISQGAEAFTFTYLGMTFATFSLDQYHYTFLLCMFVSMILARAASIFVTSLTVYAVQCCKFGLETNSICVTWFSGLIRGAVAFALVLQIEGKNQDILVSTTLGIALVTTLCLSALLGPFTKFVRLEENNGEDYSELVASNGARDALYSQHLRASGLSRFHQLWRRIDDACLTPYFGSKPSTEGQEIWQRLWAEEGIEINQLGRSK